MIIKNLKKVLIIVLAIVFMFQMTSVFSAAGATTPDWTGYTAISNKTELNNVRNNLYGKYYLTDDIAFSASDFALGGAFYNGGAGWNPISIDFFTPFNGTFDGNGHTISGLCCNITTASTTYVDFGLFGCNKGTIQNLGMTQGNITINITKTTFISVSAGWIAGENRGAINNCYNTGDVNVTLNSPAGSYIKAGGIAGANLGPISGCHNTGSVSASCDYVEAGGIAGDESWGTINSCYNTGDVKVTSTHNAYAGGIAGNNYTDTINDCYNKGGVSATSSSNNVYAGGIVGSDSGGKYSNCYNTGSISATCAGGISGFTFEKAMISNCYNTGSISATLQSGPACLGGIVGINYCTITGCYNTGNISAAYSSSNVGGVAGQNFSATITNCYYLNSISKGAGYGSDTATALGVDKLKQQSSFTGFDFVNIWQMNNYSPYLKGFSNPVVTFDSNGGSSVESQTTNYNAVISKPTKPIRAGYHFNGWYTSAVGGTEITFPYTVTDAVTLYAQWTSYKPGDINGDDSVDLMDITTLSRYVSGWQDIIVVTEALDVNGSGEVDLMDVTLLSRFNAGWNVTIQ